MLGTAPKRPYRPIIVWAGQNVKEYLAWGMSLVAGLVLMCPVCGGRLIGNGWRMRIARQRSKGVEPFAQRIPVHQLVCPRCRDAGRHPWNFRVLPSILCPFQHFLQRVRLAVFDLAWQGQQRPLAIEAETGVDRWLVRVWLAKALEVLPLALPLLGAALQACGGQWPALVGTEELWTRWWALGLALRAAFGRVDPVLQQTPGSVLEWLAVLGAQRRCWWAP